MRKVKQIAAKICGAGYMMIDAPLNEFIETLPKKGEEIIDIKYATDNRGNVYFAMVEYNVCEDDK